MFPTDPGQVDTTLGIAFHADSAMLRGIRSRAADTTLARVNGSILCVRSENDTGNNPHNPMFGVNKAGLDGDLTTLIGTRSSDSGGRSGAPMSMYDPTVRPTRVSRPSEARSLVDAGSLSDLLNNQEAVAVMQTTQGLSALKVADLAADKAIQDLVNCGYEQSTDLVDRYGDPNVLDPELDTDIVGQAGSIFTQNELDQSSSLRGTASVMKLVVNGFAGAGTVESGGYDYHDSTRATGEIADFRAGVMIGAALEYAARRNTKIMLYIFSDGSVGAENADRSTTRPRAGANSSGARTRALPPRP